MSMIGSFLLPGDGVRIDDEDKEVTDIQRKCVLGPGLMEEGDNIIAVKAGVLRKRQPLIYWIDSEQKRYVAAKGDSVIGIVTNASGDNFRVDIGTSEQASLSYMAFEGSTKKNRPNVKIGDLVYARLLVATRAIEPELVCIDGRGRSSGFGVLPDDGFLIYTSATLARRLLESDSNTLKSLGKPGPYEIAVGLNGRIWIKGRSIRETLDIANVISQAEHLSTKQVKALVRKLDYGDEQEDLVYRAGGLLNQRQKK